jgi:biotin operon repressor
MLNIKKLRQAGYKVRVLHTRKYNTIQKIGGTYKEISPKGGETFIEITTPDKNLTTAGASICSDKELYDRKKGNEIALGRAIKTMEDRGHTITTEDEELAMMA